MLNAPLPARPHAPTGVLRYAIDWFQHQANETGGRVFNGVDRFLEFDSPVRNAPLAPAPLSG